MAHNVIDAVAAGCIPITNFPNWATFVDEQDCLAPTDAAFLVAAVERALTCLPPKPSGCAPTFGATTTAISTPQPSRRPLEAPSDDATFYLLTDHPELLAEVRSGSIAFPAAPVPPADPPRQRLGAGSDLAARRA